MGTPARAVAVRSTDFVSGAKLTPPRLVLLGGGSEAAGSDPADGTGVAVDDGDEMVGDRLETD